MARLARIRFATTSFPAERTSLTSDRTVRARQRIQLSLTDAGCCRSDQTTATTTGPRPASSNKEASRPEFKRDHSGRIRFFQQTGGEYDYVRSRWCRGFVNHPILRESKESIPRFRARPLPARSFAVHLRSFAGLTSRFVIRMRTLMLATFE